MKLTKWMFGAMALALMASCSDKDVPDSGDPNGDVGIVKGISYLGFDLELPSEPISRAENDKFDDGTKEEYAVNNAAIILFMGETEADAKFIGAYPIDDTSVSFDQPNKDQITLSFQKAIKVIDRPVITGKNKLWGLAILNYSTDIFTVISSSEDANYGNLTIKTVDVSGSTVTSIVLNDKNQPTFSTFRNYLTNSSFLRKNQDTLKGIFMTNAPLSTHPGTSSGASQAKIQTLALLNHENFKDKLDDAEHSPAGCIFVERAVAKVTCSNFPTTVKIPYTQVSLSDTGTREYITNDEFVLNVNSVAWLIDNEEKTSYLVRNASRYQDDLWATVNEGKYRFLGTVGMDDRVYDPNSIHAENTTSTWYRTYWCKDPNYDTDRDFNDQAKNGNYVALTSTNNESFTSSVPLYSRENTFDVAHQNYKHTTRVVFKVKYEVPNNTEAALYAVRGQQSTFYLRSDAENLLKGSVLGSQELHDLILKYKKLTTVNYSEADIDFSFERAARVYDSEGNVVAEGTVDEVNGIMEGDLIIGALSFTSGFISTNFKDLSSSDRSDIAGTLATVAEAASKANHIVPLNENTCYYAANIQHFGDTYCPLPAGWKGDDVETVYEGCDAKKYLGRWGMVRNNWYDLAVKPIFKLGYSTVPNGNVTKSDDDDTEEWYLAARVHVLSWAKRTQEVEFK